jgi:hypothetical protein
VPDRTLTTVELNRAVLARQLLLERAEATVPEALDRMGQLQAQYAPSMYVGLWSRVAGLRRDQVTSALTGRTAVQGTLLRSTIHLVSAGDYWPTAMAIRAARRDSFRRVTRSDPGPAADRLRAALAAGPLRRKEIAELIGADQVNGAGLWLDLVRVPPSGTWERRRADLYGLAEDWVGPCTATEADGQRLLAERYLTGFGPAAVAEFANWAGLPSPAAAAALDAVAPRRFRAEDGTELFDLADAPLPDPGTPAPVRFLPTWDALLLVHARRAAILPEEHRSKVFHTKMPQSIGTFLVDGTVAGTWKHSAADGVGVQPFGPLAAADRQAVDEEAERLTEFYR